jgi:type IV secretory pathway VirB2 component (pilin)
MNKKFLKHAICFLMLFVMALPLLASAQDFGQDNLDKIQVPQGEEDLSVVVINIVNLVLGFLALIAVIIVLIAGFEWMTAGGNDDKVKTAQKRLRYGLTGLVIIFLAYAIVRFVLSKLGSVSGG